MLEFRSEQNKNKKKNLGKLFRRFYPAFSLCCKFSCHLTSMAANYDYYERKEDELKALKIADKQRGDAKEIKYVTNAETRRSTYSRRSSSLLITVSIHSLKANLIANELTLLTKPFIEIKDHKRGHKF